MINKQIFLLPIYILFGVLLGWASEVQKSKDSFGTRLGFRSTRNPKIHKFGTRWASKVQEIQRFVQHSSGLPKIGNPKNSFGSRVTSEDWKSKEFVRHWGDFRRMEKTKFRLVSEGASEFRRTKKTKIHFNNERYAKKEVEINFAFIIKIIQMTELNCKYLLGICYSCQKCLYCFELSQQEPCKCDKNKQPKRTKYPKRGQQIYQQTFKPDSLFPKANKYLFDANDKFGYNSNFEEPFSYTFCSTCNSQIQRYRNADKKVQQTQIKQNDNKVAPSDLSNEKEGDDVDDIEVDDDEDSDLEELKVQIIVKSKNIKASIAKTLNIKPASYENVMEKINSVVQKTLRKKVISKDYIVSYKAVNARGPSNELEDESDFQEFIGEYKRVVIAGKKMSMIVMVRDKLTKKKKSHKSSDESGFSSAEELQGRKKKKSRAIREDDLTKEEKTRSEVISTLCEMYKCNIHTTPCFIQDDRHLQLNPARLQLWAREIINKGATYEVPPSYPTFDAKSSVSVNKNNLTTQTQVSQTVPATPTPIIIQLPSQLYPNSTQEQSTSCNSNNTNSNIHLASPNTLPSIGDFLNSLDQKHNCNVYSNFENAFLEEEITVNVIRDLSDDQLRKLGVVKIGWQKNIKQAAQRFEIY
ncbi:hypothetical protein RhiirA4_482887 [Rhizophagus irregularis]|uniref:SAM domain-containing protein n=1 Tax=Rhizophagus irregularis TaxID=588596 RepID=A0A2I1HLS9_9GLOM|nr:hypothetical protein RhiirA4_482887 [Rhizophagus irregularis]